MAEKQWQSFFRQEAPRYLDNGFTRNTVAEVDFIIRELGLRPGQSILDVGCGTGRHCLELARRGFACTGIDQSAQMLAVGREASEREGLPVTFVMGDASETRLPRLFDHAICLCEGAFSLLEPGVSPVPYHARILGNIAAMLAPAGMFLLTALNGFRFARQHSDSDVERGIFDVVNLAHTEDMTGADGETVRVVEKGFMPAELKGLLEEAGFRVLSIWGGTAGSWQKKSLSLDEMEIMILSRRS